MHSKTGMLQTNENIYKLPLNKIKHNVSNIIWIFSGSTFTWDPWHLEDLWQLCHGHSTTLSQQPSHIMFNGSHSLWHLFMIFVQNIADMHSFRCWNDRYLNMATFINFTISTFYYYFTNDKILGKKPLYKVHIHIPPYFAL